MAEENNNKIIDLALARFRRRSEEPAVVEEPAPKKGIAVADVLALFPGARIIADEPPLLRASQTFIPCRYCTRDAEKDLKKKRQIITTRYNDRGERVSWHMMAQKYSPNWRNGKIIEAIYLDGTRRLQCHYCGRAVQAETKDGRNQEKELGKCESRKLS